MHEAAILGGLYILYDFSHLISLPQATLCSRPLINFVTTSCLMYAMMKPAEF